VGDIADKDWDGQGLGWTRTGDVDIAVGICTIFQQQFPHREINVGLVMSLKIALHRSN
jgi:hypothetical protein